MVEATTILFVLVYKLSVIICVVTMRPLSHNIAIMQHGIYVHRSSQGHAIASFVGQLLSSTSRVIGTRYCLLLSAGQERHAILMKGLSSPNVSVAT